KLGNVSPWTRGCEVWWTAAQSDLVNSPASHWRPYQINAHQPQACEKSTTMKQVLRSARSGKIEMAEVPVPQLLPGKVLVRNLASLVSVGTERALGEFAEKNILQKAMARPDLVRQVVEKARRDGIFSAWD